MSRYQLWVKYEDREEPTLFWDGVHLDEALEDFFGLRGIQNVESLWVKWTRPE